MLAINSFEYTDWNPPLSLERRGIPEWPKEVFPTIFQNFVYELARSTETPIELASMLTLSVVAASAHKKYQVQIKQGYIEPVNIWALAVLPPASRKSRVFAETTSPFRKWEAEQKKMIEPLIHSATSKKKTLEARIKELRAQASKADEHEFFSLQREIECLEQELPEIPTCPQIWSGDITSEHLGTIMAANDEAMALLSDEGGIFDIISGLYSDGKANIDLLLQGHTGTPVRVDRGSRPPIFMQNPAITMGLTIQPHVLTNICKSKTFRGRGLLGRFLYVIPKSNIGNRTLSEPHMNPDSQLQFQQAIERILNHPYLDEREKSHKYTLLLSSQAYEKWLEHAQLVEKLMGDEIGLFAHITDWAGKLSGAIGRIAGLLHIMRHVHTNPWEHTISLEDMNMAVKIGHILSNHALIAFDLLHEDAGMQIARNLYGWIVQEKVTVFTQRECLRKFRRYNKTEIRSGLEILKEHEIIRERENRQENSIGRPSNIFDVNPLLFQE